MGVKVLKPLVEKELDLPPVAGNLVISSAGGVIGGVRKTQDVYKPDVEDENIIPPKTIAYATISESINTQERRILGQFQFGKAGAIRIGEYKQGQSGEILISPNGITAKNQAGETTFTIDGTTGDATFRGTIQANSLIAGLVYVGSGSGSAGVFIDGANKRIIINDGITDRILIGYQPGGF